jgi:hypothetical protein
MESTRRLFRARGHADAGLQQRSLNDSPFNDSPSNTPRANDSAISAGAEPLAPWSEDSSSIWSQEPGTVCWTEEEVAMFAKQFHNDTIHEVHQKLFCDWIFQDSDNLALAKQYIRELSVDQVSKLAMLIIVRLTASRSTTLLESKATVSGVY